MVCSLSLRKRPQATSQPFPMTSQWVKLWHLVLTKEAILLAPNQQASSTTHRRLKIKVNFQRAIQCQRLSLVKVEEIIKIIPLKITKLFTLLLDPRTERRRRSLTPSLPIWWRRPRVSMSPIIPQETLRYLTLRFLLSTPKEAWMHTSTWKAAEARTLKSIPNSPITSSRRTRPKRFRDIQTVLQLQWLNQPCSDSFKGELLSTHRNPIPDSLSKFHPNILLHHLNSQWLRNHFLIPLSKEPIYLISSLALNPQLANLTPTSNTHNSNHLRFSWKSAPR